MSQIYFTSIWILLTFTIWYGFNVVCFSKLILSLILIVRYSECRILNQLWCLEMDPFRKDLGLDKVIRMELCV